MPEAQRGSDFEKQLTPPPLPKRNGGQRRAKSAGLSEKKLFGDVEMPVNLPEVPISPEEADIIEKEVKEAGVAKKVIVNPEYLKDVAKVEAARAKVEAALSRSKGKIASETPPTSKSSTAASQKKGFWDKIKDWARG